MLGHLILFLVSVVGGAFGTLIGGCSLLTIPVLIFLGLPAPVALGTNRFGLMGMSLIGWYQFHRKKLINYPIGYLVALPATVGAGLGTCLVLEVQEETLQRIIAGLSILMLAAFLFNPKKGLEPTFVKPGRKHFILGGVIALILGIYGGFYGVAFATALNYLLIFLFGQTFLESAATHKIAMVFLSVFSTILFAAHDAIHYSLGVTQFLGMSVGSYIGAHYSDRIGNVWLRRMILWLGAVLAVKLLF